VLYLTITKKEKKMESNRVLEIVLRVRHYLFISAKKEERKK
jgi:hypothetical protein